MGFFILTFFLSIPAFLFTILAWRLRTPVLFWLGVIFTGFIFLLYIFEIEFIISCFTHIDSMLLGVFFLALLGVPVFFLISSKIKKSSGDDDVTDDYLNSIINSPDEDIDLE
jgi:hypothetical protein